MSTNKIQIENKTTEYLNTFLEKEGYQLIKTEYVTEDGINYLRVYIDLTEKEKEQRSEDAEIGINDCAAVSRRLSKWLDQEDFIPEEYTLEVCSKGYLNPPQVMPEEWIDESDPD